jgi:hypothetical protein
MPAAVGATVYRDLLAFYGWYCRFSSGLRWQAIRDQQRIAKMFWAGANPAPKGAAVPNEDRRVHVSRIPNPASRVPFSALLYPGTSGQIRP